MIFHYIYSTMFSLSIQLLICNLCFGDTFWKPATVIPSNIFPPFSISAFFLGLLLFIRWCTWSFLTGLWDFVYISSVLFPLPFKIRWSLFIYLQISWYFFSATQICCWMIPIKFSFHVLYFSNSKISFFLEKHLTSWLIFYIWWIIVAKLSAF